MSSFDYNAPAELFLAKPIKCFCLTQFRQWLQGFNFCLSCLCPGRGNAPRTAAVDLAGLLAALEISLRTPPRHPGEARQRSHQGRRGWCD
jgi:hypothetical protein